MKLLAGDVLEIVFTMNYGLTLGAVIGGGVATLGNLLSETVYFTLIFHIERNGGVIVEKKHHHHQGTDGD